MTVCFAPTYWLFAVVWGMEKSLSPFLELSARLNMSKSLWPGLNPFVEDSPQKSKTTNARWPILDPSLPIRCEKGCFVFKSFGRDLLAICWFFHDDSLRNKKIEKNISFGYDIRIFCPFLDDSPRERTIKKTHLFWGTISLILAPSLTIRYEIGTFRKKR